MGEPSAERVSQQIDVRIAARAGGMTGKEPDDDERQDDGGGRAKQIEGKRQWQVITLAEAMRLGREREHPEPGKSSAECDNWPRHTIPAHRAADIIPVPERAADTTLCRGTLALQPGYRG